MPPSAAFDAVRDADAPRARPAEGVITKQVVRRDANPLHGDVREYGDSTLAEGASLQVRAEPDEAALCFVVDGAVEVRPGVQAGAFDAGLEHTIVLPPSPGTRVLEVVAREPSRVMHALTGPGFGLQRA